MRYFIFTILLVVPLLLMAQSKKEQIATLNLRVDSLFGVLVNNAQTLSDKSDKIFQLSQEKDSLEKDYVFILDLKNNIMNELLDSISSLDIIREQRLQANNEIQLLSSDLSDCNANKNCTYNRLMKYVEFDPGIEWEGSLYFTSIAEDGWNDSWSLHFFYGSPEAFDSSSLIPDEIYMVSFYLSSDEVGYHTFSFNNARNATREEIHEINWQIGNY